MNKKNKELILAVGLIFVFIFVVIDGFKSKKGKNPKKVEAKLNREDKNNEKKEKVMPVVVKKTIGIASKENIESQLQRNTLDWGKDPFYNRNKGTFSFTPVVVLTGISIGKDKKGLAMIDGEIVTVGDFVGEYRIVEIEKGKVGIEKDGEIFYKVLNKD